MVELGQNIIVTLAHTEPLRLLGGALAEKERHIRLKLISAQKKTQPRFAPTFAVGGRTAGRRSQSDLRCLP